GIAAGVLFGGILTTALGWQAVFFVNVPIGLVVAVLTVRTVDPARRTGSSRGLDVPGAVTAVAGLLSLVYAIEHTDSDGWASPTTLVAFGAAAVLLAAFGVIETRAGSPLVPPSTWRIRSLVSASTVMAVVTGAVVGAIFLCSLFLQQVLGSSPVVTGLEFLPLAFFITLGAAVASKLLPKVGAKALMIGGLLIVAGGAGVLATIEADPGYWTDVLPGFVVIGLGTGPMFVAISVAAMAGIPHEKSGLASGLMMTGHEVGAALGVASLTAVAGDLTTRTGLVDGVPHAFAVVGVAMLVLAGFTALAVPRVGAAAGHGGHGMH
ncbi:MAG TPA: MFS transporter, partial [Marmoricola sp.]|nr:MFS transporter [Marmoricola sp.]